MARDVKQVIVIRKDLKMRRGKEIAQGAHAAMKWLCNRLRMGHKSGNKKHTCHLSEAEAVWVHGGFRKVTCQVSSEEELLELASQAREAGLVVEIVRDAGKTEFDGVPTNTAISIGPDYDDKIDPITRDLKLY